MGYGAREGVICSARGDAGGDCEFKGLLNRRTEGNVQGKTRAKNSPLSLTENSTMHY